MRLLQLKLVRWIAAITAPIWFYLLVALIGSHVPVNPDWQEPAQGVTIYVTDNGYHTGLILPVDAQNIDLSLVFRGSDLPDPHLMGRWLVFGWGDQEFYLNTPSWEEFKPQTALAAFVGSNAALLHVDHLMRPEQAYRTRPIRLTPAQYRMLVQRILADTKRGADGFPTAIPGYGQRDVFYPAKGRYSLTHTCNNWTAEVLADAGVRVGRWTPFAGGVMRWF
jgi:uncharacterized protein (TIGR02117 family)